MYKRRYFILLIYIILFIYLFITYFKIEKLGIRQLINNLYS